MSAPGRTATPVRKAAYLATGTGDLPLRVRKTRTPKKAESRKQMVFSKMFKRNFQSEPHSKLRSASLQTPGRNYSHCRVRSPQRPQTDGGGAETPEYGSPASVVFTPSSIDIPIPNEVLNLGITTTPEVESLNCNIEDSIWVAVDIEGKIDYTVPANPELLPGLDVLIVVDNSHSMSADGLAKAHELIFGTVLLLRNPHDRVAIFCTNCQHPLQKSRVTACQLYPLSTPSLETIRSELDYTRTRPIHASHKVSKLAETVGSAISFLADPSELCRMPLRPGACQVLVFSSDPWQCLNDISDDNVHSIHYINPSVIPFPLHASGMYFGQAPRLALATLRNGTAVNIQNYQDPCKQIRQIIRNARYARPCEYMYNLSVDIKPRSGCEIEEVIGDCSQVTLELGQITTLLVKVKVDMAATQSTPPEDLHNSEAQYEMRKMIAEFEALFLESDVSLFTVKVAYQHTMFGPTTHLFTKETCDIPKTQRPTTYRSLPTAEANHASRAELYRRRAFYITTHYSTDEAYKALLRNYEEQDRCTNCFDFLRAIYDELEHQKRAMVYRSSIIPTDIIAEPTTDTLPCLGRFSFENGQTKLFSVGHELSRLRSNSDSPVTVIHQKLTEDDDEPDEAAKIWRQMRQLRSAKNSDECFGATSNDAIREIKRRALQNKRSVGADTLRSLALVAPAVLQEGASAGSSWL